MKRGNDGKEVRGHDGKGGPRHEGSRNARDLSHLASAFQRHPRESGVQSQQHDVSLDSRFRGNDGKDEARE
jgi:hypothetical protein